MKIKRDFDYYLNLHYLVTNSLLHLLCKIAASETHFSVATRNEILVRFLKPKLMDKSLANVKKDIRAMLKIGRTKEGNLERRLYALNSHVVKTRLVGVEKLYHLLSYLDDKENIESYLFEEGMKMVEGTIYVIDEELEYGFDDNHRQITPISMFIQSKTAPRLIDVIYQHGLFVAEMKKWNSNTYQAHILINARC